MFVYHLSTVFGEILNSQKFAGTFCNFSFPPLSYFPASQKYSLKITHPVLSNFFCDFLKFCENLKDSIFRTNIFMSNINKPFGSATLDVM